MNIHDMVIEKIAKEMQLAIDQAVFQSFFNNESMQIIWVRNEEYPLFLIARVKYDHGSVTPTGLRSDDIDPIQDWCVQNKCGVRTSFDMFKFRNEKEMSMFLLKWG